MSMTADHTSYLWAESLEVLAVEIRQQWRCDISERIPEISPSYEVDVPCGDAGTELTVRAVGNCWLAKLVDQERLTGDREDARYAEEIRLDAQKALQRAEREIQEHQRATARG